jgi:hypothetical protein
VGIDVLDPIDGSTRSIAVGAHEVTPGPDGVVEETLVGDVSPEPQPILWSRDGRRVLFLSVTGPGSLDRPRSLHVVDVSTGAISVVVPNVTSFDLASADRP